MTPTIVTRVLALLMMVCLIPSPALGQQVAGQAPMLLVGDQFQFTPGTWATYILHDKRDDTYSTLTMSVLESVRHNGQDSAWIELKVETAAELVVTRLLANKTPSGPGEVFEAIVYVHGLQPFRIPQRWLKGDEQEVGKASRAVITAKAAPRQMTFGGRVLEVIDVDATDETGARVVATVSAGVAPMGILTVDSTEIGMYLEDWGTGARTGIVGKPVSFVEWTATMVARGIAGKDVALPAKPRRSMDIAGVWEEADGPCVGSEWTFTGAHPGVTNQTWRSDRILTFDYAGKERAAGQVLVVFSTPTRAVIVFVAPSGRRTIATLVKVQRT